MSFAFYQPSPALSNYITCLWHVNLHVPYQRERILPMGTTELIINFGAPFRLYDRGDPSQFALQTESWLVGLQTSYLLNEPIAETHMIGVRFKPGGAYPFFPLPASELHNQVVPVDALWGGFIVEARERLYERPSVQARFELLERMLCDRLHAAPYGLDAVQHAVNEIARSHGALSIKALSEHVGVSHKHLAAQFKRTVGVSPKSLARIYRFQHALHRIDPTAAVDWAAIAQDTFYYDQSHFNKDFAIFTGFSPGEYLRLRQQHIRNAILEKQDIFFVPVG